MTHTDDPGHRRLSWPSVTRTRWINLAVILATGSLPVRYAIRAIFWPTVWINKHTMIDGVAVQRVELSVHAAPWTGRLEVATPGVLLLVLVGWPGYLLVRSVLCEHLDAEKVFTADAIARREAASFWCCAGSLITVVAALVCNWLLGRSLGGHIGVQDEMLFIPIVLLVASIAASVLTSHGRRLQAELDQVI